MSKFDIVYELLNNRSYTITLTPTGMIDMKNVKFLVEIIDPSIDYFSMDQNKFSPDIYTLNSTVIWTYLKGPELTGDENTTITNIDLINDQMNSFFGMQYVQEVKKSGVLMLFMPGAQLSASAVLHNGKPSQNTYEAARFWSSFVFLEVPSWEEDGK